MDKHPIEKANSNVPSRALVPKNWKMTEDVAARIIKPSLSKDKNTLKEDILFKTKHSIKKTKIGVSTTSSSKAASMPRVIKTKSTQTEYNPINKKKLTLASRYSHLQSLLSTLEFMESITHRTIEHSRINSSEKQAVLHEFNIQCAELNRDEVFKIQSLYSKRSLSKQKKWSRRKITKTFLHIICGVSLFSVTMIIFMPTRLNITYKSLYNCLSINTHHHNSTKVPLIQNQFRAHHQQYDRHKLCPTTTIMHDVWPRNLWSILLW